MNDLRDSFDCEPNEYFELRPEPKTPVKFRYLRKPASGGCIRAVGKDQNPLRVPNDIVNETSGSSGTLTMFCFHNNKHYALTCFHVGCKTDRQRYDEVFSAEELRGIRESHDIDWYKEYAKNSYEYLYCPSESPRHESTPDLADNINLGTFSEGSFDTESDIMSIEVFGHVDIDCRIVEIDSPSSVIWKELHERVNICREKVPVIVKKVRYPSVLANGYIEEMNYSYKTDEGQNCYTSAITIQISSDPSLKPGDSGALVCFFDNSNKQQAFGYVVCEAGNLDEVGKLDEAGNPDDEFVFFKEEPLSLFICLKLNIALEKLGLSIGKGCFEKCGSDN